VLSGFSSHLQLSSAEALAVRQAELPRTKRALELVCRLVGVWLSGWLAVWLAGMFVGWFVGWLAFLMASWLVGLLVGWFAVLFAS